MARTQRSLSREGATNILRLGVRSTAALGDWYHWLLTLSWPRLAALVLAGYLGANALYAVGYYVGGGVDGMRTAVDAFYFSVQTMSTIGYGRMVPSSHWANALVTLEALSGLLGFAMVTGLVFAKFSRPTARVIFSRCMVVTVRDGVPSLMLRMANERASTIAEAQIRLTMLRDDFTVEGEKVRRIVDLPLARASSPVFALSFTAVHRVDAASPLDGYDGERLARDNCEFVVTLLGIDQTFSATVHVRHGYSWDDVLWDRRFVDIFSIRSDGRRAVDYTKFHDVTESTPTVAEWRAARKAQG